MKIGQALSARPDLLPRDYLEILSGLQDRLPSFPSDIAMAVIEEELGRPLGEMFAELSAEPVAAASLGQVRAPTGQRTDVVFKKGGRGVAAGVDKVLSRPVGEMFAEL